MKKILNIVTSVKGKESFTIKLSTAIIEKLTADYPGSTVVTRDLNKNPFPHFEETLLGGFYAPEAIKTKEQQEAVKHSDEAIKEVMEADILVIGVPMYNFGIPSTLKAWIDHIARAGVTFKHTEKGVEGLINGKQVHLAIASGSVYSEGPMKAFDFTENYMRAIFGFLGMTDITVFRAEATGTPELKDTAIAKALEKINEFAF
jgi:FMN-dependent NADH-azoreductase